MRIRRDGQRYVQDRNAQSFPFTPRDPAEAIKTETVHCLDMLARYAPKWEHGDGVEVKTARLALLDLIRFLEGNQ